MDLQTRLSSSRKEKGRREKPRGLLLRSKVYCTSLVYFLFLANCTQGSCPIKEVYFNIGDKVQVRVNSVLPEEKRVLVTPRPNECKYKYVLDKPKVKVCSMSELDSLTLEHIRKQFNYTCFLYRRFLKSKGQVLGVVATRYPKIHIITLEHMNNERYFSKRNERVTLLGKYYLRTGKIYVTQNILKDKRNTDLPHELVHWLNQETGQISGNKDEEYAREFEVYYMKYTR